MRSTPQKPVQTADASTQPARLAGWRATPPWMWWTLLAIIAVDDFLPLCRLDQRGSVDEGCYLVKFRIVLSVVKLLAHQLRWYHAEHPTHVLDYIALQTFPHVSAKSTHAACGALRLWLFGNSIHSVLPVLAIFGILSILFLRFFPNRVLQNAHASSVCFWMFVRGAC